MNHQLNGIAESIRHRTIQTFTGFVQWIYSSMHDYFRQTADGSLPY